MILFRYAPRQEATAVFSVYHPHGVFYAVDMVANITVPGFQSCVINIDVRETIRREYNVSIIRRKETGSAFSINNIFIRSTM